MLCISSLTLSHIRFMNTEVFESCQETWELWAKCFLCTDHMDAAPFAVGTWQCWLSRCFSAKPTKWRWNDDILSNHRKTVLLFLESVLGIKQRFVWLFYTYECCFYTTTHATFEIPFIISFLCGIQHQTKREFSLSPFLVDFNNFCGPLTTMQ